MPDLNKLPSKPAPENASEEKPDKAAIGRPSYLFVDYDLIHVDPKDFNKIYGNWRQTASAACQDKKVDRWVDRRSMQNYDFAQPCPPSGDGIWRFTIV